MKFTKSTYFVFTALFIYLCIFDLQATAKRFSLNPELAPFYHGVASGDPLADRVILWTRVTPGDNDPAFIDVEWEIALDTLFNQIVNSGNTSTDASKDYTVNVDADGLQANTWYYFRFNALGETSTIGRTRTAPSGNVDQLRVAVVSCSNYQAGYFNAYERMASRNDIDLVIHLGDYIYEYETGGYGYFTAERAHNPDHETVTLEDYRIRYSHYRLDPDLQLAHQNYPWIVVWDDHESANDSWFGGAENHDASQGDWFDRKGNSITAYYEWLPMRRPDPSDFERIWRNISFGDLVDFIMIDTRLYARDEPLGVTSSDLNDPNRTMLGDVQYNWLIDQMTNSNARWKIIGQQVMMAPLRALGQVLNADQWDGYQAERANLYNDILGNNVENVVVLTGDIHTSWANNLIDNSGNNVAVEVVTTSITSPGFPFQLPLNLIQAANSHVQWANITERGYTILDITEDRTQADWYHVPTVTERIYEDSRAASWFVNHQERFFRESPTGSVQDIPNPSLAPAPSIFSSSPEKSIPMTILGTYPNPFENHFTLQYYLFEEANLKLTVTDMGAKTIFKQQLNENSPGYYLSKIDLTGIPAGQYILSINNGNHVMTRKIYKVR